MICRMLLTLYCSGYQIEKNEMGGGCTRSSGGVKERCIRGFSMVT
jgi:hypothetical protein